MTRVPKDELERIKREVSIVRLVETYGVKLTGHGDNLMGLCPMHLDTSPSLLVSPAKNLWHCLGACQTGGSVVDWVMKTKRVTFRLAIEMLKKGDSSLAVDGPVVTNHPALETAIETDLETHALKRRVVDYYNRVLKEEPDPIAYLEERAINNGEMVDYFKLGYCNRTLGYRIPDKAIVAGRMMRGQLERLGIFRSTGHEHFFGCLVIPVFAEDGRVMEMYGRKIKKHHQKPGAPQHLYLPKQEHGRGVFNIAALGASKEIILTEALIDSLSFWNAGFRNVTSAYGVEGFTEEMWEAMKAHGTRKLLIAYDRDDAGDKAAEDLAKELGPLGLEIFRVRFPRGMDANDYARKMQPANKSFELLIRGAEWMAGTRPVAVPEAIEPAPSHPPATPLPPPRAKKKAAAAQGPVVIAAEPPAATAAPAIDVEPIPAAERASAAPEPHPLVALPRAGDGALAADPSKDEHRITFGDRNWRVRGLAKNSSYESLRLNVLVARGDDFFVDSLELYSARQRAAFLKQASDELKVDELVVKGDLGKLVLLLEDLVHQQITSALKSEKKIEMSDDDRNAAITLLRDPKLLDRILADFDKAGVVGEETNKLMGYLAAVSRKLEAPLAVVIQSSSAAGKSSLMDAILRFIPEEERVQYSAMTGQSLFYMGEANLSHKILAIAEEEGAQSASYALKLLQSEGQLTIASTGKDPTSGKHVTHEYKVEGPVMIFMTTTAIEVDEELLNRCLVLTVDEGSKQTAAIHDRQRAAQTLEGLLARQDRNAIVHLHQNAQRLLEPLFVANPFARELRFTHHATRARRDHMKYLTLINSIALLHQHQRTIHEIEHHRKKVRYIEVEKGDLEIADRLASIVLGQSDDLPPQTRRLLAAIEELVTARAEIEGIDRSIVRVTRREIREHARISHTQLRVHVGRLEALEYLLPHNGAGGKRRIFYELAMTAAPVQNGKLGGVGGHLAGSWRGHGGPTPRQELPSHSNGKADLGGVNGKALIRPAKKKPTPTEKPS